MPVLCCGRSSDVVENKGKRPSKKGEEDSNNNEEESRESEVADDTQYTDDTPGQSNGLLKSSPRRQKYEVNPDPETTVTSTDDTTMSGKKGKKVPKKKGSPPPGGEGESEMTSQKSTPAKKKNAKKSSFKQTEEMEMNPLDPGFFNTNTVQAAQQLYSQHTFEEDDEEFLENVEEERRKNKQRQRLKKKISNASQTPRVDPAQAAYERAQQEIDKVLGPRNPRNTSSASDNTRDSDKKRSKRRSKKGQVNEAYSDTEQAGTSRPATLQHSESLEEVKNRVHALLDDAFSLLSNSYSSIGNRVAPASPRKREMATEVEGTAQQRKGSGQAMPDVEELRGVSMAPKPGEKLHTPLHVERTYTDYDPDGLVTWSPYRASDQSARIVLPEPQANDPKAPKQERTQTTTFTESATPGAGSEGYYTTQPGQPIFIRTKQLAQSSAPEATPPTHREKDSGVKDASRFYKTGRDAEEDYTPYPGLEAYEEMLGENTTTTALYTAAPTAQRRGSSGVPVLERQTSVNGEEPYTRSVLSVVEKKPAENGDDNDLSQTAPSKHQPPSRNIGTTDERDVIASSMQTGASPKDLVDSIRRELQTVSSKMATGELGTQSTVGGDTRKSRAAANGDANGLSGLVRDPNGHITRDTKPVKKPRKSSYLDSN